MKSSFLPASACFFPLNALAEASSDGAAISLFWLTPFILMLLAIALAPVMLNHHWEKNSIKLLVSVLLSSPIAYYFTTTIPGGSAILGHGLSEYVSFITLITSLFAISGGIFIGGRYSATPAKNTSYLAVGGLLASFIGTTGASVILIRPLIRANKTRTRILHTVIFFIFIVGNTGGCLTPLGDPPLFVGYLAGVPFTWTFSLYPEWLFLNTLLLLIYYLFDRYLFSREKEQVKTNCLSPEKVYLRGYDNIFMLSLLVASVAFITTRPWREIVLIVLAVSSLIFTSKDIRKENGFNWFPVIEVATIFLGIFITLAPVLVILKSHGPSLGIASASAYFWTTGVLSSFLDNTPTYIVFFNLAKSLQLPGGVAGVPELILSAISLGAVFFGSLTYIGNAPNFLIKAIAEREGINMPSFFGYMKWSIVIVVPLLGALSLLFFR